MARTGRTPNASPTGKKKPIVTVTVTTKPAAKPGNRTPPPGRKR